MVENKSQTAIPTPEVASNGKPLKWNNKVLFTFPNGKQSYLTPREKTIAEKVNKLYEEGKISSVVSEKSLNNFFRQRYILGLEGEEKFFAKQYYKAYVLDFVKFKKQQDKRKKNLQQLRTGAEDEE